jgi:hypothetical protein
MCDKKTLIELKNLFMADWFTNPNHHYVKFHYMQTFKYQRYEIGGTPDKRFFNGKYFSDECIDAFFKSDFAEIIKADENFEKK